MTRTLVGVAAVVLLAGCTKKTPSPQFAEAQDLYTTLTGSKGDDAWVDPEMDRVYTLCNAVTAKSSDFEAARKLMATIDEQRAHRGVYGAPKTPTPAAPEAPNWPDFPKPAEDAPDAGPAEPSIAGIEVGTDFRVVMARYGPCFTATSVQVDVADQGKADGYLWANAVGCPPKLAAGAADKLILVQHDKVIRIVNKSDMQTRTYEDPGDGGARVQVGGPPPEVYDAGAAAAVVDAGAP